MLEMHFWDSLKNLWSAQPFRPLQISLQQFGDVLVSLVLLASETKS